jgi:protein SCO1
MSQAMDRMGTGTDRIVPIFITIDPERDTPAALKQYMPAFGPRFVGLTGTPAQFAAVERDYRVYARKEVLDSRGNYGFEHSSVLYLIGPDGRLLSSYDERVLPEALAKDLRVKISRVGSPF